MNQEKYRHGRSPGNDLKVAVMEGRGKLIMECILETKAILALVRGLQGSLSVTFVPFFATRLRRLLEWRKSQGAVRHRELS